MGARRATLGRTRDPGAQSPGHSWLDARRLSDGFKHLQPHPGQLAVLFGDMRPAIISNPEGDAVLRGNDSRHGLPAILEPILTSLPS